MNERIDTIAESDAEQVYDSEYCTCTRYICFNNARKRGTVRDLEHALGHLERQCSC